MNTADGNDDGLVAGLTRDESHYLSALFVGYDGSAGEAGLACHLADEPAIL